MTTEGPVWVDEDFALKLAVQMRKEERIFHGTPIGETVAEWALCLQSIADVLRARDEELSALRAHHNELVNEVTKEAQKWTFIAVGQKILDIVAKHLP